MYWNGYDTAYKSYDLGWDAIQKSLEAILPITVPDSAEVASTVSVSNSVTPSMMDIIETQLASYDIINPVLTADLLNQIGSSDTTYPSLGQITVANILADLELSPTISGLSYVAATLDSFDILKPNIADLVSQIFWDNYDVQFDTYDLSFQTSEAVNFWKTIALESDNIVYPKVEIPSPSITLESSDTIYLDLIREIKRIASNIFTYEQLYPITSDSKKIGLNSGTIIYPDLTEIMLNYYINGTDTVIPYFADIGLVEGSTSLTESLYPILVDIARAVILQPTSLKYFTGTGLIQIPIKVKQLDGTWQTTVINMKQIDKSWM